MMDNKIIFTSLADRQNNRLPHESLHHFVINHSVENRPCLAIVEQAAAEEKNESKQSADG